MTRYWLPAAVLVFSATSAFAGPIEKACLKSGRDVASPSLCGCIQQVADMTLNASDQRLAAKFFRDPDMAQEVRMSDRSSHEAFWLRYTGFGEAAQELCAS
ncbi:MAG: hypothetical protein R3D84_04440 [Paracoccaceae bacterium]